MRSTTRSHRPRLALVGVGAMGSNHARVIAESAGADLGVIVDTDTARAARLAEQYGCRHGGDVSAAADCDAAVVATPTRLHGEQTRLLLDMRLPVLVEKPMTPSISETRVLVDLASESGVPLMCGFVERFNPAVQTVCSMLEEAPLHIVGLRHSPHTPRTTLSVTLDLLIHEIDCALRYTGGCLPAQVSSAIGVHPHGAVSDAAGCLLSFDSGAVATLSASRTSQRKVRWQTVDTPSVSYEIDLLRQNVTVYRHRGHEVRGALSYRAETVIDIPFVRHAGEPLALQLLHFLSLLEGERDPVPERASILAAHEVAALVDAA